MRDSTESNVLSRNQRTAGKQVREYPLPMNWNVSRKLALTPALSPEERENFRPSRCKSLPASHVLTAGRMVSKASPMPGVWLARDIQNARKTAYSQIFPDIPAYSRVSEAKYFLPRAVRGIGWTASYRIISHPGWAVSNRDWAGNQTNSR